MVKFIARLYLATRIVLGAASMEPTSFYTGTKRSLSVPVCAMPWEHVWLLSMGLHTEVEEIIKHMIASCRAQQMQVAAMEGWPIWIST